MAPLWPTTCFGIKDSSVYLNMKMAKRDSTRALTVLKPCGNAFSAQKTYMGSILDRKTSNFGWKCPKKAFLAILDKNVKVQSWCSTTWEDLQTWLMAQNDPSNLLYKIRTEKFFLPLTILEYWHFECDGTAQNGPKIGIFGSEYHLRSDQKNFWCPNLVKDIASVILSHRSGL